MSDSLSVSRWLALRALVQYQKTRRKPSIILRELEPSNVTREDRDLAWELTNGSIRYLKKLDFIARSFVRAPLERQRPEVLAALRLGLYQLSETSNIPAFAAINETVALVKDLLSPREAGFVNAVLRNFTRKQVRYPDRDSDPVGFLANYYSYPEWLVKRWLTRFEIDETEAILKAGNERPKLSLRILIGKITVEDAIRTIADEGIAVERSRYFADYIRCDRAAAILRSSAFKRGIIIVQDESQGIAVKLLEVQQGETALDLCAAPGGKSIALADTIGEMGKVISLDNNPKQMEVLRQNAERTRIGNIEIIESDLFEFATEGKFGYILLDVPCSGLGTIAARADLRWSKSEGDIARLAEIQAAMLEKAAGLLQEKGVLVYSTCTTEPEEIEEIIEGFLKRNTEFRLEDGNSSELKPFKTSIGIYRSWTHKHGIGGGGFARLVKNR